MNIFNVSEIYQAIQGEGTSIGVPCNILRLQGCSNKCKFCDSNFAWAKKSTKLIGMRQIFEQLNNSCEYLVLTGGEPLENSKFALLLLNLVQINYINYIDIETAGFINPKQYSQLFINPKIKFIISPKLSFMEPKNPINKKLLASYMSFYHVFKFVVQSVDNLLEIEQLQKKLKIPSHNIIIMPEGIKTKTQTSIAKKIYAKCISLNYRLLLRQHILMFGDKRKV